MEVEEFVAALIGVRYRRIETGRAEDSATIQKRETESDVERADMSPALRTLLSPNVIEVEAVVKDASIHAFQRGYSRFDLDSREV